MLIVNPLYYLARPPELDDPTAALSFGGWVGGWGLPRPPIKHPRIPPSYLFLLTAAGRRLPRFRRGGWRSLSLCEPYATAWSRLGWERPWDSSAARSRSRLVLEIRIRASRTAAMGLLSVLGRFISQVGEV